MKNTYQVFADILTEIQIERDCSERQLRRYLRLFNIKPLGIRQRPQRYPANTGLTILARLGSGTTQMPGEPIITVKEAKRRAKR